MSSATAVARCKERRTVVVGVLSSATAVVCCKERRTVVVGAFSSATAVARNVSRQNKCSRFRARLDSYAHCQPQLSSKNNQ